MTIKTIINTKTTSQPTTITTKEKTDIGTKVKHLITHFNTLSSEPLPQPVKKAIIPLTSLSSPPTTAPTHKHPLHTPPAKDNDHDSSPVITTPVVKIDPPFKTAPTRASVRLKMFVYEKAKKFGVKCILSYLPGEHAMSISAVKDTTFDLKINPLYLLLKEDIDIFLDGKPEHKDTLRKFLTEKKPEQLNQAASDLVDWFNSYALSLQQVVNNGDMKLLAKELLIMHTLGKLDNAKHFLLTHEISHAHDHSGAKSLGDFEPTSLSFIKPHQYGETRADLAAARELNAHGLGITYFAWRDIIAGQPAETDSHPTDKNRARAIKLDQVK